MYNDARNRIRKLGDFNYFVSYMSQPKFQLETFKAWAGKHSDISYYLNSHHIDFHCWAMQGIAQPSRVTAVASTGVAKEVIGVEAEDTITLSTQWHNLESKNAGSAVYTASWGAAKADVHSQQRFFYLGHKGEINIDQGHRGYTASTDDSPYASINPLYMRYTPDQQGYFTGQHGYGYMSFEKFVDAVTEIRSGTAKPADFDTSLPTAATCLLTTAILEAGRRSLDSKCTIQIDYDASGKPIGFSEVH
jgi:D-galacturonate reductase